MDIWFLPLRKLNIFEKHSYSSHESIFALNFSVTTNTSEECIVWKFAQCSTESGHFLTATFYLPSFTIFDKSFLSGLFLSAYDWDEWSVCNIYIYIYIYIYIKLATVVEGDLKAPFSLATTTRCRVECNSFSWIAPFYPWSVPYNAEC